MGISRSASTRSSLSALFILTSVSTFGQWSTLPSVTGNNLLDIAFIDANNGTAVGANNTAVATSDGWSLVATSLFPSTYRAVAFPGPNAYCIGDFGESNRSTDGGFNWTSMNSLVIDDLHGIYFIHNDTGYFCGASGKIGSTINGGVTWNNIDIGNDVLLDIHFPNSSIGYTVGQSGAVHKSIDGGSNWIAQNSGTLDDITSVFFTDMDTGFAVGAGGLFLNTSNGGTTWNSTTISTLDLTDVRFTSSQRGFIVGDSGTILQTMNGGQNWTPMVSPTLQKLHAIHLPNDTVAFACGNNGTVIRWQQPSVSVKEKPVELSLNAFPNPTKNKVHLNRSVKWEVWNTMGKLVSEGKGRLIDLNSHTAGVYFLRADSASLTIMKQ